MGPLFLVPFFFFFLYNYMNVIIDFFEVRVVEWVKEIGIISGH